MSAREKKQEKVTDADFADLLMGAIGLFLLFAGLSSDTKTHEFDPQSKMCKACPFFDECGEKHSKAEVH